MTLSLQDVPLSYVRRKRCKMPSQQQGTMFHMLTSKAVRRRSKKRMPRLKLSFAILVIPHLGDDECFPPGHEACFIPRPARSFSKSSLFILYFG